MKSRTASGGPVPEGGLDKLEACCPAVRPLSEVDEQVSIERSPVGFSEEPVRLSEVEPQIVGLELGDGAD